MARFQFSIGLPTLRRIVEWGRRRAADKRLRKEVGKVKVDLERYETAVEALDSHIKEHRRLLTEERERDEALMKKHEAMVRRSHGRDVEQED